MKGEKGSKRETVYLKEKLRNISSHPMDSNVLNVNELELIGEGKTKRIYALKKDNDKV